MGARVMEEIFKAIIDYIIESLNTRTKLLVVIAIIIITIIIVAALIR